MHLLPRGPKRKLSIIGYSQSYYPQSIFRSAFRPKSNLTGRLSQDLLFQDFRVYLKSFANNRNSAESKQ